MATCPSCGGDVSDGAPYCRHCSAPQPERTPPVSTPVVHPPPVEPPPAFEEFVPLPERRPDAPDPAALDPDAIRALNLEPTPLSAGRRSHRSTQIALVAIGVVTLLGMGGLALLMGSLRDAGVDAGPTSPPALAAPGFTSAAPVASGQDLQAQSSLQTVATAAQAAYGARSTFADLDAAALGLLPPLQATQEASTGPNVVSFATTETTFTASSMGTPLSCWFVRVSQDPAATGVVWNHSNTQTCAASEEPAGVWTPQPPPPGQVPVEPSPASPR